ncbi:MAG: type II toxin-antitoxin system PemK/MazF family toxin [Tepidisphaeraceae bacterium]|jgi:mRNA interferase MazF
MARITHPRRGEIWLVSFDPAIGAEIQKTRPALIIQNDIGNRLSPITVVAAITSSHRRTYPVEVYLPRQEGGLDVDSVVTLNQIRSIDRRRLIRRLGMVSDETVKAVDQAILISLGINLEP